MPIPVTCPGCLKRFSVAEKFAGKQGPCPNCKKTITIPKLEEQVVIHAPDHSEAGAIGAGGRNVLKTFKRTDTKFQPLLFAGVVGVVLLSILAALALRFAATKDTWMLATGAMILGPLLSWAGYTFLRDAELEAYQGGQLALRSVACGLVYALLWLAWVFLGKQFFGPEAVKKGLELWQLGVLMVPVFAAGTLAAFASFDLEPTNAFFHCAMYFAITVMLRLVADMPAVPWLGALK